MILLLMTEKAAFISCFHAILRAGILEASLLYKLLWFHSLLTFVLSKKLLPESVVDNKVPEAHSKECS